MYFHVSDVHCSLSFFIADVVLFTDKELKFWILFDLLNCSSSMRFLFKNGKQSSIRVWKDIQWMSSNISMTDSAVGSE